ncbi:uncharacterized protein Bfra_006626 [Botrytis fragariae]|uniref:Uncharacterized protein n=1 Tax=Botrytis fragariae TaxID=1964551 RepID=A0A8H6B5L6_9HELO|nr:uncharacterized protein Bfra_006626 [Botrytis fragariae]KAF5879417.1 hypothetical protein Bfra_006626 [Botrytis fragariae]
MGRPQPERLALMPEERKVRMREQKRRSVWEAAEELERHAEKTKGLADDATNIDKNGGDEENEEEEEEEKEGSDEDERVREYREKMTTRKKE